MDVPVTELRAHLAEWIARVHDGDEVVVTDRGTPIARLVPVEAAGLLERLVAEGVLERPRRATRRSAREIRPVKARGSVSGLVREQ